MFDDEEDDDGGFFLLVMGVLAGVLILVTVIARSGDDLPEATVTGPTTSEVVEEAAPETTAAPAPTTTEAPAATAAPATTAAPQPVLLWDALLDSGESGQFTTIGGALGLQAALEATEDADGNPAELTIFAPSDAAVGALDPAVLAGLVEDPDAANALVGYHFIDQALTAEDIIALDGQTITTRTGLPLAVEVEEGSVILNGTTTVTVTDIEADNGVAHIIDNVLQPPTVNQLLGGEDKPASRRIEFVVQ